ncbi:hypothetical protein IKF34_03265 [Candidatus Saccharibacteria bacterium]|nr:hypothetical protein [Candidatus Saccharibacteria bacterium]
MKNLAKMYYAWPAIGLTGLTMIALLALTISPSSATTSSATASVIVPVSCNLSTNIDSVHSATINNGTYKDDIGKTTLKVVCNDNSGFAIYAVGYSNDTFGNNKLVANVGGTLSPTNDIVTGTTTSGNTSNWAMKITPIAGTYSPIIGSDTNGSFANYHIVPDKYVKVATFNSTTDATIGSSIEATYRAYISSTQPAGTYTGKVKYTMVHPASEVPLQPRDATPRCISYWPNASGVVDSMGDQCSFGDNATVAALWASNFKRPGYGFVGWSNKFDWVLNENDANGNGTGPNEGYHIYGPNQSITTPADMTTKGLSLYAVWAKSNGNLQGWNYCSALGTGKVTALTDQRDNNTYAIAKLADGKCWMIENLRLDNTNSDNATGTLAQGYGQSTAYGNFSGLAEPETTNFSDFTAANSLYYSGTQSGTASINIGTSNYPGYRFPRFNNQNTTSPVTNMTNASGNTYGYGNRYTWPTAVADTGYYTSGSVTTTSICPKGWHLPQGGRKGNIDNSEYWKLSRAIIGYDPANFANDYFYYTGSTEGADASKKLRGFPNNFIYSGYFSGSSAVNRGILGQYWSSSVNNSDVSYVLYFYGSNVYPGTSGVYRFVGLSVRCLAGS